MMVPYDTLMLALKPTNIKMHQSSKMLLFAVISALLPSLAPAFIGSPSRQRSKSKHRHVPKPFSATTPATSLGMGLLDLSWGSSSTRSSGTNAQSDYNIKIEEEVGSGSYGVVHLCHLLPADSDVEVIDDTIKIAKRAWTDKDLIDLSQKAASANTIDSDQTDAKSVSMTSKEARENADRCRYYIDVERHCLNKLASSDNDEVKKYVPTLIGVYNDNVDSNEWLVFDMISPDGTTSGQHPAPTLYDILEEDWIDQHAQDDADPKAHHHLYVLQKAFGMRNESSFGDVLDKVLLELLRVLSAVNSNNIVHRDVKPGNLLVHSGGADESGSFILIDFGSAADMDPQSTLAAFGGSGGRVGLENEGRVALSPIYCAPEMFVKPDRSPLNFDSFSMAFMFTQLLFNLLDEPAVASYRQQLEDCDFNLDSWLQRELSSELQPDGIDDAVLYLSERPGVWAVLRNMLHSDPERRMSTSVALKKVERILSGSETGVIEEADGKFFAEIIQLFDQCEIPDSGAVIGVNDKPTDAAARTSEEDSMSVSLTEQALVIPHPLHYIVTFKLSEPLGILLSEVDPDGQYDDDLTEDDAKIWEDATANALPGEVFVRGTVNGGQAESIGILEVGDRLMGVGDFPFKAEGFNTVIEMIQAQPQLAATVTLHFSRKSVGRSHSYESTEPHRAKVDDQGAFKLTGRRKTQEDRFILHEVQDGKNAVLLTGVFDGHGGAAASTSLAQLMPSLLSVELAGMSDATSTTVQANALRDALESAYEIACRTYRQGCDSEGLCIADYDPREGIIIAGTGASDVVAGSTVTMSCLSVAEDGADFLTVVNCGDSRTLAFGRPRGEFSKDSVVYFSTRDHSPSCDIEIQRLASNPAYSQPKCSMSRWRIKVGDYQYALARSLEGSFATSAGIVSDPDISMVNLSEMLAERELCSIMLASDGLFEVIDNEQAGRYVTQWREDGLNADEVAKKLCRKAFELGSPDNVSVVVLYLS